MNRRTFLKIASMGSVAFAAGCSAKSEDNLFTMVRANEDMVTGQAASLVLGMGLTTTAVYITVAALIVPALEKIGVEPIAAHMYAFYFGVVSTITPPVALAAFAAAAIAGTGPMATAVESTRVGIAKYLVPLAFAYNPSLLLVGPTWLSLISTAAALLGLAKTGYRLRSSIWWPIPMSRHGELPCRPRWRSGLTRPSRICRSWIC